MRYLSSVYDPPRNNLGLDFYPQNPYGFTTEDDAIYSGVANPVFYEKGNFTPRLTQQDILDLVAGKKVVATEKQLGYSREDLRDAYISGRNALNSQESELMTVGGGSVPYRNNWFPAANSNLVQPLSEGNPFYRKIGIDRWNYNPMMEYDNFHTNPSTVIDGKRYLAPEFAMEAIYRSSGRPAERNALAFYYGSGKNINDELGKLDYERFVDPKEKKYREEVTNAYLKTPEARDALEQYMSTPLINYQPRLSHYPNYANKPFEKSSYDNKSNTTNLDYQELLELRGSAQLLPEVFIQSPNTKMTDIFGHEYAHSRDEYKDNIVKELVEKYADQPNVFYDRLNEIYPQKRIIEGLNKNYYRSGLSGSDKRKMVNKFMDNESGNEILSNYIPRDASSYLNDLKKKKDFDPVLGYTVPGTPSYTHSLSAPELMSDIRAIQKYMTEHPELYDGYDSSNPDSFVTEKMVKTLQEAFKGGNFPLNRLIKTFEFDTDIIRVLMNLASNEPSTPSYMPNRRFFPSAGEYSYS